MARPGITVVSGGNVDTVPEWEQTFSSEHQSPKVTKPFKGTFTTNANGGGRSSIFHGLPYRPVAFAFYRLPGEYWLPIDNTSVGIQTNLLDFVIESYDAGNPFIASRWKNKVVEYKAWLLLDPAQGEI
jgi:hypothetical protein